MEAREALATEKEITPKSIRTMAAIFSLKVPPEISP